MSGARNGLKKIASFWIGDQLSYVEFLVIQSYLDNGHDFILYTLDDVGPVPKGIELRDARSILDPAFPLGPGRRHNNAVFSDIFRLLMIQETGAIWSDLDAYCLRPINLPTDYVFGIEIEPDGIANGILGLPPESQALQRSIELVSMKNPIPPYFIRKHRKRYAEAAARGETFGFENFSWGASGPKLLSHFLKESGEIVHAQPKDVFYPGPRPFRRPLLRPDVPDSVFETDMTLSIHFWGKTKKFLLEDHDGLPPEGCYLDRLCRRHGINAEDYPIARTAAIPRNSAGMDN